MKEPAAKSKSVGPGNATDPKAPQEDDGVYKLDPLEVIDIALKIPGITPVLKHDLLVKKLKILESYNNSYEEGNSPELRPEKDPLSTMRDVDSDDSDATEMDLLENHDLDNVVGEPSDLDLESLIGPSRLSGAMGTSSPSRATHPPSPSMKHGSPSNETDVNLCVNPPAGKTSRSGSSPGLSSVHTAVGSGVWPLISREFSPHPRKQSMQPPTESEDLSPRARKLQVENEKITPYLSPRARKLSDTSTPQVANKPVLFATKPQAKSSTSGSPSPQNNLEVSVSPSPPSDRRRSLRPQPMSPGVPPNASAMNSSKRTNPGPPKRRVHNTSPPLESRSNTSPSLGTEVASGMRTAKIRHRRATEPNVSFSGHKSPDGHTWYPASEAAEAEMEHLREQLKSAYRCIFEQQLQIEALQLKKANANLKMGSNDPDGFLSVLPSSSASSASSASSDPRSPIPYPYTSRRASQSMKESLSKEPDLFAETSPGPRSASRSIPMRAAESIKLSPQRTDGT